MPTIRKTEIEGKIWTLGDNINTDDIVPSHVLTCQDNSEIVCATLENIIPEFSSQVFPGDWVIGGKNFGCGSSREEAVFVFKELQLGGIIASSFARIFYRNAINLGLPVISIENPESIGKKGDVILVDLDKGKITNKNSNKQIIFVPFPPFLQNIINSGGLLNNLK